MLQLAEIPIDLTLPGTKGEENGVYDSDLAFELGTGLF